MKFARSLVVSRMPALWLLALPSALVLTGTLAADEWPQWRGPARDGVWNEQGVIDKFPESQIKVSWRTSIGGGYSGPTVAHGRVYVTDRVTEPKEIERVHCFDAKTGKSLWTYAYDCSNRSIANTRRSITRPGPVRR